jgi:hypothetical protein
MLMTAIPRGFVWGADCGDGLVDAAVDDSTGFREV